MVPQAMIWVMPSTDTARQGPATMSRRLGIARPVFTGRAPKARSDLRRHLGFGKGRHFRREAVEPGHEPGMRRPPVAGKAEIAVAEKAGERELADVRDRIERRRFGLERLKPALDLFGLVVGPFLHVML